MDLKLKEHVRNTIIFIPYEENVGWNSDIWTFSNSKKINFGTGTGSNIL